MYDPRYYAERKQKLVQKSNSLVQRFLNTTFDFVSDANDNAALMKELDEKELESKAKEPKQGVGGQPEEVGPEQKIDKPKN